MARRKKEKRSLENPAVNLDSPNAYNYLASERGSAGIAIDRFSVLGYPAVWRALNLVSGKVARLPLDVFRETSKGGKETDWEHPAHWLLARKPSSLYTPHTFKKTLINHALLHGNGFAWILRDGLGRPEELIILNPECTGIAIENGRLVYFTRIDDNETRKLLPENVLHIKGMGHDGLVGYSALDLLREAFGIGLAAQRYGANFFRNGGAPGMFVLKFPSGVQLTKEKVNDLRAQWDKMHTGLDNAHKYAVLGNGGDIEAFKVDNDTAQFLQTREYEVACGIANIFGIPAHKLGVKVSTSYNSLESEERSFLNDTLDDWLVSIEEECEIKLLKESQLIRDSHFVEFDRRSLEQADYKTRSETLVSEVNNGLRTQNEARALLNLPTVEDGERLRMPANIVFADTVDDLAEQAAQPPIVQPGGQDPADVQTENDLAARFQTLHDATMKRLHERIKKALTHAIEKRIEFDATPHVEVMVESGLGLTYRQAEQTINAWIKETR